MKSDKEEFIRNFREVQSKFSRLWDRVLATTNLTLPQYAILHQLASGGAVSMTEVGGKLHITKPAVTGLVDRLEKRQFLKRVPHPKDRRIFLLQIQPRGEKMVRRARSQVLSLFLKTLSQFSSAEQKTMSRFYASLSKTMDAVLSRP